MRSFPFKVKTQDARAAIRVGASVGVPLYAIYMVDRLDIAVFAAFGALTSLYGHSESVQRRVDTQLVVAGGIIATVAAAAVFSAAQGPTWLLALTLMVVVLSTGTLGAVMKWVPRGEIFFILVLLVIASIPVTFDALPLAIATSAAAAGFAVLLTLLEPKDTVDPRRLGTRLRERAKTGSESLEGRQHAIAIIAAAVGVVGAWLLALSLGIGHPFWTPITVAALIPALTSTDAVRRMTQLMLGTIGGVCLAGLLFSAEPGPLALITLIMICQAIAELFVARNYAVALVFISPLAIGMSNMGRGLPWPPLMIDRLLEAALGTMVALITILVGRALLARAMPPSGADSASPPRTAGHQPPA